MTHTPGPWHAVPTGYTKTGLIGGESWFEVKVLFPGSPLRVIAPMVDRDDARLIAAAPDLLEAMEGILEVANVRIDDPRIAQFDAARAAIAKAKGEA